MKKNIVKVKDLETYWSEIISQMFLYAGYKDLDEIEMTGDWNKRYTMTQHQWSRFEAWCYKYLKEKTKARKAVMRFSSGSKKNVSAWIDMFHLNYGLKIE